MKKRIIEVAVKVIVAALTAFLTAITTTSCLGYGPFKSKRAGIAKDVSPFYAKVFVDFLRYTTLKIWKCRRYLLSLHPQMRFASEK
ncbi:MAG: hypothetical protein J5502_10125 [Prevotella sp.]|nr:hypothetical protein [Prevotella sp.]